MYRCQMCGQSTKPGQPIQRVVTQTRIKEYHPRVYWTPGKAGRKVEDPGGEGREIAKELKVCPDCSFRHWAETEAKGVQVEVVHGGGR